MNNKAIVLAGGFDQIALIRELKSRGFEVALIDFYENPPAKSFADIHYVGSTLDLDFVRKKIHEFTPNIITTACTDQALMTVAIVSEEFGLPCYITAETARNVTNKVFMKKVLIENDIPTSRYYSARSIRDVYSMDLTFPVIVKPSDCNSSKGVKKANDLDELVEYTKRALDLSRSHYAIIEEFKDGIEYSADFFIQDGSARLLCVTESKKIKGNDAFTIAQSIYPVVTDEQFYAIEQIGCKIADTFSLTNSPLLVQLIEENGKFYVIEFSARMGGGSKYQLIQELTGVNIMSKYVDLILGKQTPINATISKDVVEVDYLYCHSGTYEQHIGVDDMLEEGIISHFFQYKKPPISVMDALTSSDRIGGILIKGRSKEEVLNKRLEFNSRFRVYDKEKNDIFDHNFMLTL